MLGHGLQLCSGAGHRRPAEGAVAAHDSRGLEPGRGHGKWPTLVGETVRNQGNKDRTGLLLCRVDFKCEVRARVHAQVSSVWASGSGVRVVPPALKAASQELMG